MYQIPNEYAARFAPGCPVVPKLTHGRTTYPIVSLRLTSPVCAERLSIGSVCAARVEARVAGMADLTGEMVTITAQTPDGAASLPLGAFRVAESRLSDGTGELIAYDAAWYAMQEEYIPGAQPPATALTLLADVAQQCGLTLGDVSGLTDQSVTGALSGYTCKELAGYLAALVGCNAVIDREGRLALRWFKDHGQTVTPDVYYSGALKLDAPRTLAGVRMRKTTTTISADSDGIRHETTDTATYEAGSGSGVVIEVENPFATQAIVDAVWTALHGAITTFRTGSCAYFGGLTVEPGDLLTITDTDNQSCVFPVMSAVLELDGGCKATVSGAAEPETALSVGVRGPVGRLLGRIEADLASFKELTADNFTAAVAKVDNLYADQAWVQNLFAQTIDADHLNIGGSSKIGLFEFQGYGDQRPFALVLNTTETDIHGDPYRDSVVRIANDGFAVSQKIYPFNTRDEYSLTRSLGLYMKKKDDNNDFISSAELSPATIGQQALYFNLTEHPGEQNETVTETTISAKVAQFGGDVNVTGDLTVTGEVTGSNIPIIQQGNTGPISGVSSAKTAVAVTFDTAFPGAPKVFLTPIQNGGYMPTVKLETVSSSGFRLAITIPSGSTNSISVDWMAIYV